MLVGDNDGEEEDGDDELIKASNGESERHHTFMWSRALTAVLKPDTTHMLELLLLLLAK